MSSHVFKIETGVLALTPVGDSDDPAWQTPGGVDIATVTLADYTTASGIEFSCQVTSGALNASANTTDDTTPATFCGPEVTETTVGVTSYTLDATILQDPDVAQGISAWLFEHDTESAYFMLGLDGENPPKAVGIVRAVAGAIGGDARVTLTADLSLPVSRKPDVMFGNATTSRIVYGGGGAVKATQFTAGTPGTIVPGNAAAPTTLAELQAQTPPVTASPATAWTTGQYVQLPGSGSSTGGRVHWTSSAWAAGAAS